jgi:hypothetical protein
VLFNKGLSNLLAAGRIVSAKGDGWEITTVMIKQNKPAGEFQVSAIQKILEKRRPSPLLVSMRLPGLP